MDTADTGAPLHPIQVAARRSGLRPDVLRAWERRYSAVTPQRSDSGRRLYTDADVSRLRILAALTRAGHRISDIAGHPTETLVELAGADDGVDSAIATPGEAEPGLLPLAIEAVESLDGVRLKHVMHRAMVVNAPSVFIEAFIVPLMSELGTRWWNGTLGVSHEHVATPLVRSALLELATVPTRQGAPRMVVTTPAGQIHEIGAMLVAATAALEGWDVTYLGTDVPADDIAAAVRTREAAALALSIVHPTDDPHLEWELRRLRQGVPARVPILFGGRAAPHYRGALEAIGAVHLPSLGDLRSFLHGKWPTDGDGPAERVVGLLDDSR